MYDREDKDIRLGDLVQLKPSASGYPMIADPEKELGIGLVIEYGTDDFKKNPMVKVLWTRTQAKRWEFVDDLVIVEHT